MPFFSVWSDSCRGGGYHLNASELVASQAEKVITGIVQDVNGEPIIGASVIQDKTSNGVITGVDGSFSLNVPEGAKVVIACLGYQDNVITVGKQTHFVITLQDSAEFLEEVVVVGMNNRQTRRSITGAVSTIQTKELVQSPVANISNALAGKLPGLITVQSSGEPGADAANLYIRGLGTYGSSAPLVVIDGLPRNKADFDMLDPNEIESITILKDASSSSLYGIQGANGVVVVSTRRGGGNAKPKISFTVQQALQQPIRLPETMSSYQQALYHRATDFNDGQPMRYTDEVLEIIKSGSDPYQYPNTNWFDVVLKEHSWQQQYNINISGSAGKDNRVNYFISGSYINQGTLLNHEDVFRKNYGVNSKYDRYNFRSNVDVQATKRLNIRIDLAGRLETRVGPSESFPYVFQVITTRKPSSQAIYNPDGTLAAGSALEIPYQNNPYGVITQSGYYTNQSNVMYGTVSAKYDLDFITDGLTVQAYFSFENTNNLNRIWRQSFEQFWYRGLDKDGNDFYQDYTTKGRLAASTSSYVERYTYYDIRLNYDKTFGKHQVNAQLLGNRTLKNLQYQEYLYAYQGLSARAAYNYAQRYFLEINLGYNGSENFPPGKRYGVFPAFSAGWVLSDEPWLNSPDWLKILKIRGSYGTVGNDQIGGDRFLFITEFGPGGTHAHAGAATIYPSGYYFGTTNGGTLAAGGHNEIRVGNEYVTWEKAKKANVGFDLSLFHNNAVNLTFDYFYEKRDNILTAAGSVPDYVGIDNVAPRNSGKVLNQGLEAELRIMKQVSRDFSFFANFQVTYAKNKVLENDQPTPKFDYQDLRGYEIGYDLGYKSLGYFKDQADIDNSPKQNLGLDPIPGDVKYQDTNNDGIVDVDDRVPIKCFSVPTFTGGLSLGINWKGFDFSMMFSGATGGTARLWAYDSSIINLQRWTESNKDALLPIAHTSANNNVTSDWNLMSTDYLKLRNIELGYTIPSHLLNRIKISSARVYINGQNIAVWDKMWLKDRDPESAGSGTLPYPLQRIFNIGLRFDL
ncbi:MAG: TonB-dependent receptor [Bacteroidales bacterium]|nr:TonB-dependent receptor [Bacteroidales bacterium]